MSAARESTEPSSRGADASSRAAETSSRASTSEFVAERLRVHMLTEGLKPGDRLGREEDLARGFGVSRPTLREALRLLSSLHLVRASKGPGGGIFVAATPEQGIGMSVGAALGSMLEADSIGLDELLETRILLEVPLAGLAAQRAGDDDLATLKALERELDDADDNLDQIGELDVRLHRLIADIAHNRLGGAFAASIVDVLQPRLAKVIEPAVVEAVLADQIRTLIAAIARGDPHAAERAMRDHLVYLQDLVAVVRRD